MKTVNQFLLAAVMATTLGLAGSANAQIKVNEGDGIAASPRVRQMLNERRASRAAVTMAPGPATAPEVTQGRPVSTGDNLAASPRALQLLSEKQTGGGRRPLQVAGVGYQPTGADGITASPKLRQRLDEQSTVIMVAPVK